MSSLTAVQPGQRKSSMLRKMTQQTRHPAVYLPGRCPSKQPIRRPSLQPLLHCMGSAIKEITVYLKI